MQFKSLFAHAAFKLKRIVVVVSEKNAGTVSTLCLAGSPIVVIVIASGKAESGADCNE
jgi:hypothetical protein